MVKYCPYCGVEVESDFQFCPECGKEMPTKTKSKKTEPTKKEEKQVKTEEKIETKEQEKPKITPKKKGKLAIKWPTHKFKKLPRKTMMVLFGIIAIVVIVVVSSVGIYLIGNMNANVTPGGGRTFTLSVTNDFTKDAECFFKIDNLRQLTCGDPGFTVTAGETEEITINEDDLEYLRESYKITLYATIDDVEEFDDALSVTESAEFVINGVEGSINQYYVNCTTFS
jgi:predicted nucleic acid-binding Zn ribbon protein